MIITRQRSVRSMAFALCLLVAPVVTGAHSSEIEDIRMAEEGFMTSLAVQASPKWRALCNENSPACIGPDRVFLALELIAARSSRPSLLALARLVRFSLDGAYAEDYDSRVTDKGKKISGILATLNPDELRAQCSKEFADLARTHKSALEGVHEDQVCADRSSIQENVRELLDAIRHGKSSEL